MEQSETKLHPEHEKMKPYISFVTVARNDDHGGNFLERMYIFISALLEQVEKYNINSELIIVDWNPPDDRPNLTQILSSTFSSELFKNIPCKIRIIQVSPEIHKQFQNFDKISLFQMIGKNVGIRRARGEFIVATNIDVLFSDDLMKSLASKSLKPEFFYRIDRYDVDKIPYGDVVQEQLDYCENNVIRIHRKDGSFETLSGWGIFLCKWKIALGHFRKYLESSLWNISEDRVSIRASFRKGREEIRASFRKGREEIRASFRKGREEIRASFRKGREEIRASFRKGREETRASVKDERTEISSLVQYAKEVIQDYKKNRKQYNYSKLPKMLKIIIKIIASGIYLPTKIAVKVTVLVTIQVGVGIFLVTKHVGVGIFLVTKHVGVGIFLVTKQVGVGIFLVTKQPSKVILSPIINVTKQLKNIILPSYPKLHSNACGDFTLMKKERWYELRGYPELEIFSFNIDSLLLQMAYEDGLREKILKEPFRMYHMEHSAGWTPQSSEKIFQRLKDKGIPFMNIKEFDRLASKMHRKKSPMISNKEGWGLGSEIIPEVCIN